MKKQRRAKAPKREVSAFVKAEMGRFVNATVALDVHRQLMDYGRRLARVVSGHDFDMETLLMRERMSAVQALLGAELSFPVNATSKEAIRLAKLILGTEDFRQFDSWYSDKFGYLPLSRDYSGEHTANLGLAELLSQYVRCTKRRLLEVELRHLRAGLYEDLQDALRSELKKDLGEMKEGWDRIESAVTALDECLNDKRIEAALVASCPDHPLIKNRNQVERLSLLAHAESEAGDGWLDEKLALAMNGLAPKFVEFIERFLSDNVIEYRDEPDEPEPGA